MSDLDRAKAMTQAAILVALAWADRDATAAEDKNSERIYP